MSSPSGRPGPTDTATDNAPSWGHRLRHLLFGAPRDLSDRSLFHKLSLVPFLAWVGLGADGLSSSSYGPPEAFVTLGNHRYLAVALALATALTVAIIAAAYSQIIAEFPLGGGGYMVASKLLGRKAGVVSGCALLVDYVMTITVSIAAAGDALFSLLPLGWHVAKLPVEILLILSLTTLNIRGVRESVVSLVPIFLLFVVTHVLLLGGAALGHLGDIPAVTQSVARDARWGVGSLGWMGVILLFARAYSMGGGTYTGLEAVSNGLPILREPKVQSGRRTMTYMAFSLALTAGGLLFCYLLLGTNLEPGKTLNATLAEQVVGNLPLGSVFVIATLVSEGALLMVGAQAGFIGGPRVLANMALDGWMPRRFTGLSERLTNEKGIMLMGGSALAAMIYTRGDVSHLLVMYAINVFLTFSLSMAGMLKGAIARWRAHRAFGRIALFGVGLALCATVLVGTTIEKFSQGGWLTVFVTVSLVFVSFAIRSHYKTVGAKLALLDKELSEIPETSDKPLRAFEPNQPTAVVLVGGYNGLGVHLTMSVLRTFGDHFRNLFFVSVGAIDTAAMRSESELAAVRKRTEEALGKYIEFTTKLGMPARYDYGVGTDTVEELEKICVKVSQELPNVTFFSGQLILRRERWYHAILHNQTAYDLQKRLQWVGLMSVIMPVRLR